MKRIDNFGWVLYTNECVSISICIDSSTHKAIDWLNKLDILGYALSGDGTENCKRKGNQYCDVLSKGFRKSCSDRWPQHFPTSNGTIHFDMRKWSVNPSIIIFSHCFHLHRTIEWSAPSPPPPQPHKTLTGARFIEKYYYYARICIATAIIYLSTSVSHISILLRERKWKWQHLGTHIFTHTQTGRYRLTFEIEMKILLKRAINSSGEPNALNVVAHCEVLARVFACYWNTVLGRKQKLLFTIATCATAAPNYAPFAAHCDEVRTTHIPTESKRTGNSVSFIDKLISMMQFRINLFQLHNG